MKKLYSITQHKIFILLLIVLIFHLSTSFFDIYYHFSRHLTSPQTSLEFYFAQFEWIAFELFCSLMLTQILLIKRWIFIFGFVILVTLNAFSNAAAYHVSHAIEPAMIHAALFSQPAEFMDFVTPLNALIVAFGILGLVPILYIQKKLPHDPHLNKNAFLSGAILILLLCFGTSGVLRDKPPFHIISASLSILFPGHFEPIIDDTQFTRNDVTPQTIVLVIGESARGDHFSLNGYHHDTNPYLQKTSNVISFPDVTSCTAFTHTSIPCMITDETLTHFNEKQGMFPSWGFSLIEGFRRAGSYTGWIGMQSKWVSYQIPFLSLARSADFVAFPTENNTAANAADDKLIFPDIERFLKQPHATKFLIIHLNGSHTPYSIRYPETFEYFKPTCPKQIEQKHASIRPQDCEKIHPEALINTYDNSLRYTDFIISHIISLLTKQNALLLYTSDHGESLGEQGIYGHGILSIKEQRKVPFLMWASENYIHSYPDNWKNIQNAKTMALSHDHVFHSLLDCGQITSVRIDKNLSLCDPRIRPQPPLHFNYNSKTVLEKLGTF